MFKQFDLPILFDISTTKSVDKNKLDFVDDGEYDFIGRTSVDWGIQGKLHKLSFEPNPKDSFSLIQVGETVALWREREWYASQNLFLLNPRIDKIKENNLYFQGAINKEMSRYGKEYNSYPTMKSLVVTKIVLPVIENPNPDHEYTVDDIDWQYMRDRITELERDRITELDAYLQATGLNDYELTEDDKKILSLCKRASDEDGTLEDNSEDEVRFDLFRVDEIFEVVGTKSLDAGAVEFKDKGINFVGRTYENNGIQGKIDKQDYEPNNSNTITATVIGNYKYVKYQEEPYYCSQNINKLTLLDKFNYTLNRLSADYLIALIRKFVEQYNGQQGGYKLPELKGYKMLLPIKSDGTPDFDYMERYIRAMEKVVIADVVKYKDKVIETTKKVVGE